jgi:hypothetical protein
MIVNPSLPILLPLLIMIVRSWLRHFINIISHDIGLITLIIIFEYATASGSLLPPHIRSIQGFAGGVGLCTFAGLHRRAHGAPFPPKKTAGQLQGASFFGLSDPSAPPVNGLRVGNEVESERHALFFIAAMHSKCTSDPRAARRTVPLLRGMRRGGGGSQKGGYR